MTAGIVRVVGTDLGVCSEHGNEVEEGGLDVRCHAVIGLTDGHCHPLMRLRAHWPSENSAAWSFIG